MDSLFDFLRTVTDPRQLVGLLQGWPGYAILFAIVFAETGLLMGFFLPGDSLMFTIGVVTGAGHLDFVTANLVLMAAAVLGDSFGYYLGFRTGPKIFNREDSRFFKRRHLIRTHEFYEKHGGKTIIYARFVPIVRTFAPFVAGVGGMNYRRFITFNVFGGIGWVACITTLGYLLGEVPIVKNNFEKAILLVIALSLVPVGLEILKHRLAIRREKEMRIPVTAGEPD